MKIYTYFDASPKIPHQGDIIRLWRDSWQKRGWEPRILNPRTYVAHKQFKEFRRLLKAAGADPLTMARKMRWLALETVGGGWFSEYDVINYGLLADRKRPLFSARSFSPELSLVYLDKKHCAEIVQAMILCPGDLEVGAFRNIDVFFDHDPSLHVSFDQPEWLVSKTVHFSADSIPPTVLKYEAIERCGRTI